MIYYVTKKTNKLAILPTEKKKKKILTKLEYKHFILAYNYKLKCQTIVIIQFDFYL